MGNGVNQCRLFDHPCGYSLLLDRGGSACNFIILPFEFLEVKKRSRIQRLKKVEFARRFGWTFNNKIRITQRFYIILLMFFLKKYPYKLYLFFNLKNLNYIRMTSVIYSLLLIFIIIARVLQNDFFQYFTKTHWWNVLFENILIFSTISWRLFGWNFPAPEFSTDGVMKNTFE